MPYKFLKELITINIDIKPENKTREFFHNLHSKLEDILFSVIQKIPESLIPAFLMEWLDSYITKRTQELQQSIVRQKWQQVHLEKAVEEVRKKQAKK